jgi:hypothetical protein
VLLASLARDAFGQAGALPAVVIGVLNFALVLEEFEVTFYSAGLAAPNLIPGPDRPIFERILANETAHRNALRATLGPAARPRPTFDLTGGSGSGNGFYANGLTDYEVYKAMAQAFEDNGVRAYKGQAPALLPYDDVLTTALTIHSVEARHAAEVRRLRGNFEDIAPFTAWIPGSTANVPGPAAGVYQGEGNTIQGGVDVTTVTTVSAERVSEAFDEPLTQAQVFALVRPFLVL